VKSPEPCGHEVFNIGVGGLVFCERTKLARTFEFFGIELEEICWAEFVGFDAVTMFVGFYELWVSLACMWIRFVRRV
jgi:hypothetical protein